MSAAIVASVPACPELGDGPTRVRAWLYALVAMLSPAQVTDVTIASADDSVGGSTIGVTVWPGHPHYDDAMGLLGRLRAEAIRLREKVTEFDAAHAAPEDAAVRVITYMGQSVLEPEQDKGNGV